MGAVGIEMFGDRGDLACPDVEREVLGEGDELGEKFVDLGGDPRIGRSFAARGSDPN
jgi:hypothetical protein